MHAAQKRQAMQTAPQSLGCTLLPGEACVGGYAVAHLHPRLAAVAVSPLRALEATVRLRMGAIAAHKPCPPQTYLPAHLITGLQVRAYSSGYASQLASQHRAGSHHYAARAAHAGPGAGASACGSSPWSSGSSCGRPPWRAGTASTAASPPCRRESGARSASVTTATGNFI